MQRLRSYSVIRCEDKDKSSFGLSVSVRRKKTANVLLSLQKRKITKIHLLRQNIFS